MCWFKSEREDKGKGIFFLVRAVHLLRYARGWGVSDQAWRTKICNGIQNIKNETWQGGGWVLWIVNFSAVNDPLISDTFTGISLACHTYKPIIDDWMAWFLVISLACQKCPVHLLFFPGVLKLISTACEIEWIYIDGMKPTETNWNLREEIYWDVLEPSGTWNQVEPSGTNWNQVSFHSVPLGSSTFQ